MIEIRHLAWHIAFNQAISQKIPNNSHCNFCQLFYGRDGVVKIIHQSWHVLGKKGNKQRRRSKNSSHSSYERARAHALMRTLVEKYARALEIFFIYFIPRYLLLNKAKIKAGRQVQS